MSGTLRQKLYSFKTFEELRYNAIMGTSFGTNSDGFPDVSYKVKHGFSATIDADETQDIWAFDGNFTVLAAAETMNIASTSIADDDAGAGLDAVYLSGLDNDYNPIQEFVTLNGTANVLTTKSYIFIDNMNCLRVTATGASNAGVITATASTAATVQAQIPVGSSTSQGSHFVVPNGYTALMTDMHVSVARTSGSGTKRGVVSLYFEPLNTALSTGIVYETIRTGVSNDGGATINTFHNPLQVPEKTLIYLAGTATTVASQFSFEYDIILVKTVVDIDPVF